MTDFGHAIIGSQLVYYQGEEGNCHNISWFNGCFTDSRWTAVKGSIAC